MPELPEVEVVRRGLEVSVLGRCFQAVTVRQPRLRFPVPVVALQERVPGACVRQIARRGKYLLLHLSQGDTLLVHLGMSGRFLLTPSSSPVDRHDHVIFLLDGDEELRFRDPRRFGMVDLSRTDALAQHPRLRSLGPEPFSPELTPQAVRSRTAASRRSVKSWLMDSTFVAGLGNIYANESLFRAKIHPERPAGSISERDWARLLDAVKEVLQEAIDSGGTTLEDGGFRNILDLGGRFQLRLKVYGRGGQPCPVCGTAVQRTVQQGRSSYFCPSCQPNGLPG